MKFEELKAQKLWLLDEIQIAKLQNNKKSLESLRKELEAVQE